MALNYTTRLEMHTRGHVRPYIYIYIYGPVAEPIRCLVHAHEHRITARSPCTVTDHALDALWCCRDTCTMQEFAQKW
jgi:hypothetical protein